MKKGKIKIEINIFDFLMEQKIKNDFPFSIFLFYI